MLCRSEKYKVFCGVCGGIAEYFNIDPVLVRLAAVALFAINPGAVLTAYIIACIIMPKEPCTGKELHEEAKRVVEEVKKSIRREEIMRNAILVFGALLMVIGATILLSSLWPNIIEVISFLWYYTTMFSKIIVGLALLIVGLILVLIVTLRKEEKE